MNVISKKQGIKLVRLITLFTTYFIALNGFSQKSGKIILNKVAHSKTVKFEGQLSTFYFNANELLKSVKLWKAGNNMKKEKPYPHLDSTKYQELVNMIKGDTITINSLNPDTRRLQILIEEVLTRLFKKKEVNIQVFDIDREEYISTIKTEILKNQRTSRAGVTISIFAFYNGDYPHKKWDMIFHYYFDLDDSKAF